MSTKMYIVHLDDENFHRDSLLGLFSNLKQNIENFFKKHFKISGNQIEIELIQCGNINDFKKILFNGNELSDIGKQTAIFLLDYFLENNLKLTEQSIDNINFPEWINKFFPTIPKIFISNISSMEINFPEWKVISKNKLANSSELCGSLINILENIWVPKFSDALLDYATNNNSSWHTPGHNLGNSFLRSPFQKDFYDKYGELVFQTDLSVSVSELGDLSEPDLDSPLKKAQDLSSQVFGSKNTLYITNGTSTSNKAMLMTLLKPGEVVLLDRNCHKSIHQSIVMSGAIPLYLSPSYNSVLGLWLPIDFKQIEDYINKNYTDSTKPKMLILTTCTYEGILYPIHKISKLCKEKGILFYADEAWAPYLRFHPYYLDKDKNSYSSMDSGADFSVHSTHKTLSAFSQASMLHISHKFEEHFNDNNANWEWLKKRFGNYKKFIHNLHEVMRYWHSTSPHYPMLATLDRATVQMSIEGSTLISEKLKIVDEFTSNINKILSDCIIDLKDLVGDINLNKFDGYMKDPLKLFIKTNNTNGLKKQLSNSKIRWEKSSNGCIEFLISLGTYKDHLEDLIQVIRNNKRFLDNKNSSQYQTTDFENDIASGQIDISPQFASQCEGEFIEIEKSQGRISTQMLVPYPPGIPVFLPGLEINNKMIDLVLNSIKISGDPHSVHGIFIEDNKYYVRVLTEKEQEKALDKNNPYSYRKLILEMKDGV